MAKSTYVYVLSRRDHYHLLCRKKTQTETVSWPVCVVCLLPLHGSPSFACDACHGWAHAYEECVPDRHCNVCKHNGEL